MMVPFNRKCVGLNCAEFACFGVVKGDEGRWACLAHRELLEIGSGLPPAPPEPKAREGRLDLSVAALPLPSALASNSK
jgi:hypothetical protein